MFCGLPHNSSNLQGFPPRMCSQMPNRRDSHRSTFYSTPCLLFKKHGVWLPGYTECACNCGGPDSRLHLYDDSLTIHNKQLCCRREAARCFVSVCSFSSTISLPQAPSFIRPPLATARATSCDGRVYLFVCLFVCLSVCRQIAKTRFSQKLSNLEQCCRRLVDQSTIVDQKNSRLI